MEISAFTSVAATRAYASFRNDGTRTTTAATGGEDGVRVAQAQGEGGKRKAKSPTGAGLTDAEMTEAQRREVQGLRARDTEVRAHEQAHVSAGGSYSGAPSFKYQRGPDGRSYAVEGEVPVDASAVPRNPQATISKMEVIKRAALAPSQPSGPDRQIAAQAAQTEAQAQAELNAKGGKAASGNGRQGEGDEAKTGATGIGGTAQASGTLASGALASGSAVNSLISRGLAAYANAAGAAGFGRKPQFGISV
ncbi:SprA-related family protein [uncultured Gammaproteobacteria bacterium]